MSDAPLSATAVEATVLAHTVQELSSRLAMLAGCVERIIDAMPDDMHGLRVGDEARRAAEVLVHVRSPIPPPPTHAPPSPVKKRPPPPRSVATAVDVEELRAPFVAGAACQTVEVSCRSAIDARTRPLWGALARLQFHRVMCLYRVFTLARRATVPNPCNHARRLMHAFSSLRRVYEQQLRVLARIRTAAGAFRRDFETAHAEYVAHVAHREQLVHEAMARGFATVFEFVDVLVRSLRLADVEVTAAQLVVGPRGHSLRRKEEGVRRLRKRKPWLFVSTLGAPDAQRLADMGTSGDAPTSHPTARFNEDGVAPLPAFVSTTSPRRSSPPRTSLQHSRSSPLAVLHTPPHPPPPVIVDSSSPHPPSRGGARAPPVRLELCDTCRTAKRRHEPPPPCRSSGCPVAKTYTTIQRSVRISVAPL